ncbi:small ribosomal subunit protein uS10m isoform X2 [Rhineura floridana]|uniref:small ribosomal subunit protein uS10m isoform X2 n=1 Tax=Rhineura floridana TaxID=261503 RepID=UPI002AC88559|nr:small ribosomal subunit protein uS10m isoform X2 [Rhineura floridana]
MGIVVPIPEGHRRLSPHGLISRPYSFFYNTEGPENFLLTRRIPLKQCSFLQSNHLIWFQFSGAHTDIQQPKVNPLVSVSDEPDTLYRRLTVLVKGHDRVVLDSYEYFMVLAAKELGLTLEKVEEPPRKIERFTLLKSVHIFKKHRVQYEMRTHYRYIELKHLTGSTANVYLEYIQRNLPEGVAMEVKKTRLESLPEHIQTPVWDTLPQVEESASKS